MEITFSIVGTAGRGDDASKLSKEHFWAMYTVAEGLIDQFAENNYPITHVVSGGAAWADHVAVKLFLREKVGKLRLFFPCEFSTGRFVDTGKDDWFLNPGRTLNTYHKNFSDKSFINSLSDIQIAINEGAETYVTKGGFHGRNAMVAKSDFLLACTYGQKNMVKDGGTADTIRKYLDRVDKEGYFDKSYHYCLTDGKVYEGVKAPPKEQAEKPKFKVIKNRTNPAAFNQSNTTIVPSMFFKDFDD